MAAGFALEMFVLKFCDGKIEFKEGQFTANCITYNF